MKDYNPYKEWDRQHIDSLKDIVPLFKKDKPIISGWDTETTGLHLIKDYPFLIIFGWLVPGKVPGRVFTFYPTPQNMKIFFKMAKKTKFFVGHNATYDLGMMQNIGWRYDGTNVVENMVVARLSLEALTARQGGDKLALKSLGPKYVHPHAAYSESLVKDELSKLNKERVAVLTAALSQIPHPTDKKLQPLRYDEKKDKWVNTTRKFIENNPEAKTKIVPMAKMWTKKHVEDFLKDITHDVEDLPAEVREIWETWQKEYPEPTYEDVPRDIMIQYAGDDVITMLEFFRQAIKVLTQRKQGPVLQREMKLLKPILKMERAGLKVNRKYLEECRVNMKEYIIKKRKEMYDLAGRIVNVGQDKTILDVFRENWGITLFQCNKATLKKVVNEELDGNPHVPDEAKRYAEVIMLLRRLEKWYSTYIVRVLERSEYDGRIYFQFNPAGAVSGRFTSDSQQFPKDAIKDEEGNEMYHPRRAFIADDDSLMYYLDFSQIELRVQADYTIRTSGGDMNLCRAYIPFECYGEHKGVKGKFNYKDPEKRKFWKLDNFWKDENGEYWTPTDNHSLTAHNALLLLGYECIEQYKNYKHTGEGEAFFGDITSEAEFKSVRSKGKTANFMFNYGGGLAAAMDSLSLPRHVAQAMVDGYANSFPEVKTYQDKVADQHWKRGYVENRYGRRYYLSDYNKSYVLANYLVQGTAADLLKECIIEIDEYLESQNCKTQLVINIHDELGFKSVPGEEHIILKCREIMQSHDDMFYIPIVSDMEVTDGAWVDAEEFAC